jgi:uncharacterized protein YjbI with pentapeptide repeats
MADDLAEKPRIKAKDNPWYRLATLHGEPSDVDEIAGKNRVTWNRWMASQLTDDLKTKLLEAGCPAEELTPYSDDELRAIEAEIGSISADQIDFSDTDFEAAVFEGFVFTAITFAGATFSGYANFDSATFSGYANFASATFSGYANFDSATFSGTANFASATFSGTANFASATFSRDTNFGSATFSSYAIFESATFSRDANFGGATFSGNANFVNSEMKGVTYFENAKFGNPPQFFGAKLHEGTIWRYVRWPAPPENKKEAGDFVEAYERLKLEMDRLKKHGDELDFFARELQCRRVLLGFWRGLPLALYGALSGHGRYYMRPLAILVIIIIMGAVPIRAHFGGGWALATFTDQSFGGGALGLSFANTFGILGIRKDFIDPALLQGLPGWLKVISTIQTILGIVLLFLFGLAIRNRFRMK